MIHLFYMLTLARVVAVAKAKLLNFSGLIAGFGRADCFFLMLHVLWKKK